MLFRKDTFIGNDVKPMFVEPPLNGAEPTPSRFIGIKPEIVDPGYGVEVPTPLFVRAPSPFDIPAPIPKPIPQPVIKPLFVKPLTVVEQSQPFISQTLQENPIFQNPQDIIDQTIIQDILPIEPEPIHIPSTFEIQQTTEQISEQATLFIEPVKTKIIENETENEDINMVNDCTKHYTGGNSYFDTTPDPITKKQVLPKKPILPFEHKPFGLMRIIVSILIVYIIFLKK